MRELLAQATSVGPEKFELDFTVGTLVKDKQEYQEMISSFIAAGFSMDSCEYLYIDNTAGNRFDAFSGLNRLIKRAKGKYIILCHQDILLNFDHRIDLEQRIHQLEGLDPKWAVAGNAGAVGPNHIVYSISYPDGTTMSKGNLPLEVQSLDENFILLKNSAGLSFSADLSGFHLYGTDICLQASLKGYHSYVIDFHVLHKSRGNRDANFWKCRKEIIKKYNYSFRDKWIQTTMTCFHLSGSLVGNLHNNAVSLFCVRMWNGLKKRME